VAKDETDQTISTIGEISEIQGDQMMITIHTGKEWDQYGYQHR
jgi:hypothetical protein